MDVRWQTRTQTPTRGSKRFGGSGNRSAFTLIELILVVGVIVMIASLAVPLATRTLGRQTLRQGADKIRVAMGKARVEAIKTGNIHALFFFPEGNWFNVARFSQIDQQSGIAARDQALIRNRIHTGYEDNLLPKGIRFVGALTENDSRATQALDEVSISQDALRPVLFYPDGTSQEATVYLRDDRQNRIAVVLRGLTGTTRTVKVIQ